MSTTNREEVERAARALAIQLAPIYRDMVPLEQAIDAAYPVIRAALSRPAPATEAKCPGCGRDADFVETFHGARSCYHPFHATPRAGASEGEPVAWAIEDIVGHVAFYRQREDAESDAARWRVKVKTEHRVVPLYARPTPPPCFTCRGSGRVTVLHTDDPGFHDERCPECRPTPPPAEKCSPVRPLTPLDKAKHLLLVGPSSDEPGGWNEKHAIIAPVCHPLDGTLVVHIDQRRPTKEPPAEGVERAMITSAPSGNDAGNQAVDARQAVIDAAKEWRVANWNRPLTRENVERDNTAQHDLRVAVDALLAAERAERGGKEE